MMDSIYLSHIERVVWVMVVSGCLWTGGALINSFIKQERKVYKDSKGIYQYSSIISVIAAAIFCILLFRYAREHLLESSIPQLRQSGWYWVIAGLSFIGGFIWMSIIIRKYNSIHRRNHSGMSAEQFARNIVVFMVSLSLFSLLLSSPALLSGGIPVIIELHLVGFLGAAFSFWLPHDHKKRKGKKRSNFWSKFWDKINFDR